MVITHLMKNYGASRGPPEKHATMCTVHSFLHNIDHCLTWARSKFEGLLEKTPAEVNAFLSNPRYENVWDLVTGRLLQTRAFPLPITAIVVDPIEMKLFSGGIDY
ncbi:Ubiquitin-activating enzyme E1 2 [Camellia lanceoleosa]|uniref:Ubiquitin-activating enzyme E1 2 n=1 Tax=Camellia lanceoleosa TaxID=1840588 RepID=A0ACC0FSC3_9ERIC|nr:Ubiquitin-activating enzyme E1 2 [Camellia lanceoleosa]